MGQTRSVRVWTYVPGGSYGYGNYVYSDTSQNVDQAIMVNLLSQNPGVVQIPATTVIPAGRYYSDSVTISAVGAGSSKLVAGAAGFTDAVSGLITVVGPWMRADVTVGSGCRTTGYVGLTGGVAPPGGYTVSLTVDNPEVVSVPAAVTIPAGYSDVSFNIEGLEVGSTFVQMSVSGFVDRDSVTVVTPTFEWYSVAESLTVGQSDSVYIRTYVPGGTYAYGNGVYYSTNQAVRVALTVAISSENPAVLTAPETVTITAGNDSSGRFNMTGVSVGTSRLTASAIGWDPAQTGVITVNPAGASIPGLTFAKNFATVGFANPVEFQSGSDPDFVDDTRIDTCSSGIGGPTALMIPAMAVIGAEGKSGDEQGVLQGWNSGPRIEYNVIWGNNADVGGAIAVYNSVVTVLGNIIVGNSAEASGGAIYVDGSLASVVVRSNTIFANTTSSGEGGGVYLAGGSVSITNCILWQNSDDLFGCSATYSDVTDIVSDPGTGNISVDPGFVQTSDPFGGDYCHLAPGSQCVNAGYSDYTPLPGETDIDGQPRIASGRVDIGADELPDLNPPETVITGGPAQGTTVCSLPVNFGWTGSDDTPLEITYSWRIDNGSWSEWSTSLFTSYQSLTDGSHTFEVKARDSWGNEDPTPARRDFVLDTAAPVITDILPNAGRTSAIITWKTDEGSTSQVLYGLTSNLGQSTYLDWTIATNHAVTISNLLPNTTYFYRVRSRDGCGHESTSELLSFTTALDTTPPDTQITSGPAQDSTVCSLPVNFGFAGSDDSTPASLLTYSYRVDGGSWSEFSSSTSALIDGLSSGAHMFEVKSRDSSGNEDATPASRSFVVRLDLPIISNVQASVSQMQCTITWSTDVPCTSQVRYGETTDYGSQSPLSGSLVTSHSVVLNGLSPNKTYHYVVVSRDSCGREVVSADQTFATPPDTGEPNTWFTDGPSEGGLVCSSSQRFCWSGSDTVTPASQLTYSYRLDSGSWSAPTSETCRTFTALTEGGHTLYVRAHDTSGNVDSTPAQRSFRVDLSVGTVYNVNAVAGATEATVVWRTNEAMDSQVEYGTTTSYGLTTPVNPSLVTDHTVVISNLTPEITYHYRVRSKDGCGREVVSGDMTFTTRPDQTAPQTIITSGPPANGKTCSTTVDFCWTGSDDATPVAELVYSYKMDDQPWSVWTAEVCHQFTDLSEGLHTLMVKARDSMGNEDASPAVRYFYVDLTAPTISEGSVSASPRQTTCIINWRTTEPTTAQVEYGTATAYGQVSAIDQNMLTVHKVTISGLTPETTYHYRVRSSDGCQEVVSEDYTFTTTAVQPPNLRPTQLTVPITTSAHSTVKISWVVQNLGPGDAEGLWTDRILFSEDEIPDDQDVVLWEGVGSSPLPVPYTYSKQAQVEMPMKPVGLYYVILRVDVGAALNEVNETDNVLAQPVTFTADKPLVAAPENINIRLDPGVAAYGQFDLSNIGDTQLTGIVADVIDAPANINLSVSNVNPTMDALTNRRISYQVTALDESVLTSSPKVVFATNEGASAVVVFNLTVTPRQPKLVVNPGYLSGPMIRGKQTFYECEVVNQGGVPANDLRVLMPTANWLSLVTPADLGSLGPGEKKTVSLQLSPSADMPLGDYTSNFVVVGTNANVSVGFRFTCVSTQVGGLKVYAEDEFTTFADDHPYVAGATVTLKDYGTGEIKYQGTTGPDGVWLNESVIEANYYLEVSAEKHGTYRSPVQIVAGQTKEIHAFMPRQFVTYKWTVEPIMIEDKYRVVLEATFETHVPAPVVTIEPCTQVVPVVQGQTAVSYITVTNHGLISAHEVEVKINDTANWYVTPAIRMIGELPPMTSVRVPIYVRAKADGPITDIPEVATSTLAAEAAMAASSAAVPVAPVASLAEGGETASGDQPSLCDILSGAVVYIVYCSGGQWKITRFSLSPLLLLLDLLDLLDCLTGDIKSCLSLACSLAKVDPCICAMIDSLSVGGALN
ncbi:MAG: fibronectin type III domain-containing protein, partial [Armatimonadota bacterium]